MLIKDLMKYNRKFMDKLLKSFISTIITTSVVLFSASCESVKETVEEPINIGGVVFVDAYQIDSVDNHVAGIETFEFTEKGKFSNRTLFCYLAGEYWSLDSTVSGMYSIKGNYVTLIYPTDIKTATVKRIGDSLVLDIDDHGSFSESEKTVQTLYSEFMKSHSENFMGSVIEKAKDSITIVPNLRFLVENNETSYIITIDSISGTLKEKNQEVEFHIENVPGSFKLSDDGGRYLVRIGTSGVATTNDDYLKEAPENVIFTLSKDSEFTLVSPKFVESIKNKAKPTKFAPFVLVKENKLLR